MVMASRVNWRTKRDAAAAAAASAAGSSGGASVLALVLSPRARKAKEATAASAEARRSDENASATSEDAGTASSAAAAAEDAVVRKEAASLPPSSPVTNAGSARSVTVAATAPPPRSAAAHVGGGGGSGGALAAVRPSPAAFVQSAQRSASGVAENMLEVGLSTAGGFLNGGVLGYFFGFLGGVRNNPNAGFAFLRAMHSKALGSAASWGGVCASFSGIGTATRVLRGKEDRWNHIIASCGEPFARRPPPFAGCLFFFFLPFFGPEHAGAGTCTEVGGLLFRFRAHHLSQHLTVSSLSAFRPRQLVRAPSVSAPF
ncbi:unnamed protein product [Phaeothamnion confervicola]